MGKADSRPPALSSGFTLMELLVVLLIIGLMTATIVLAVTVTGRDREVEEESKRVFALLNYAREQAELQTRELGLFCDEHGYEFLLHDPRRALWRSIDEDESLRARKLPHGLELGLRVEGRQVVLDGASKKEKKEEERMPHVMLFSNGDMTPFELTVQREGGTPRVTLASNDDGVIEMRPMEEQPL